MNELQLREFLKRMSLEDLEKYLVKLEVEINNLESEKPKDD